VSGRTQTLTVVPCAGVPITACTPAEAAEEVVLLATSELDYGVDVHLCNAYTLALADKDANFMALLKAASINFPDGKSVVWANRLLHRNQNIPGDRVYGPDLFLDVFDQGQAHGLRHYLLGSTQSVLSKLEEELRRRFPMAEIVGTRSPPFRQQTVEEQTEQVSHIAKTHAQIVWVGLGTPKQDWESAWLAHETNAVFVAVGAAFDFVAGEKQQAPVWMQRHGLEWVFRLGSEPRRMWKRYLFGNFGFLVAAVRRK
jgi:N-acetylglucosaminyldiphosphoundecaprenol N-acetyl-beta-D-mannosaminyltransferase